MKFIILVMLIVIAYKLWYLGLNKMIEGPLEKWYKEKYKKDKDGK